VRDVAGLPDAQDGKPWEVKLEEDAGEPGKKKPKKSDAAAKAIAKAFMGEQLKRKRKA
jgi:hypothetical protein